MKLDIMKGINEELPNFGNIGCEPEDLFADYDIMKTEYICNTDCARYRQGDCPFREKEDCPRYKEYQYNDVSVNVVTSECDEWFDSIEEADQYLKLMEPGEYLQSYIVYRGGVECSDESMY